jgi:hypothetical protein
MRRLIGGTVLATVGICTAPAAAVADERVCSGAIGAETVDDLRVPQGATCELKRTRVEGNAKVEANATLRARSVRVDGNVQGENAARVVVGSSSQVGGSIQVKQGGGADVRETRVTGDIQLDANNGDLQHVAGNTVGGNVQVVSNRGGVDITGNTIDGNLQCKENSPPPTGGGNVVRGSAEDQCASLMPGGSPGGSPPGQGGVPGAPGVATLSKTSLRASRRGSRVNVPLRCASAGSGCAGRLILARRGRTSSAARLGTTRFRLAAGQRRAIHLRLNRRGRAALRRTRRLRVTITVRTKARTVRRAAVVRR